MCSKYQLLATNESAAIINGWCPLIHPLMNYQYEDMRRLNVNVGDVIDRKVLGRGISKVRVVDILPPVKYKQLINLIGPFDYKGLNFIAGVRVEPV